MNDQYDNVLSDETQEGPGTQGKQKPQDVTFKERGREGGRETTTREEPLLVRIIQCQHRNGPHVSTPVHRCPK